MAYILARKKSSSSLLRKQSQSGSVELSSTTPSNQKLREEKSIPYTKARYEALLATNSSFMTKSKQGIREASKSAYWALFNKKRSVPKDSLFYNDLFEAIYKKVKTRNEAMVIQDITRLIVPSAENLAIYGAADIECLIESVNEGWNNSIPVTKTHPQPDYLVGFRREAFTKDELNKL